MNKDDFLILSFIDMLACVRAQFRDAHAKLEKLDVFSNVDVELSPFSTSSINDHNSDTCHKNVSLSFFLDAELSEIKQPSQASIGASIVVKYIGNEWVVEGEIGWSGNEIGWDNFQDRKLSVKSIDELMKELPIFSGLLLSDLDGFVMNMDNS